jgi:hypothetical protein
MAPAVARSPARPGAHLVDNPHRDKQMIEELAAARSDMTGAIARNIEWLVDNWSTDKPLSVAEASERARSIYPITDEGRDPDQVSWHELGNMMEHAPERGAALWRSICEEAAREMATGTRAAKAVERQFAGPLERARFLVMLRGLEASLKPEGAHEHLIVHQMAVAYEQILRWEAVATQRIDGESFHADRDRRRTLETRSKREREQYEYEYGWMPPRLSDAEAIDQAVMVADRYRRAFLRLLRTLRDIRRVMGTVVMTGGQLNVAERQTVNAPEPEKT